MDKEMEEVLLVGLLIFVALRMLGTNATTTAIKNQQSDNALTLGLAGQAASVINNALDDWS